MSRHTEIALDAMQEAIDRARLRDSSRLRAHKVALACALVAPSVLADPAIDDTHKENVRLILSECKALVVGGRPDEQPETFLDGVAWDDVLATVRSEVEREIREREGVGA